jgi:hypothetical protein
MLPWEGSAQLQAREGRVGSSDHIIASVARLGLGIQDDGDDTAPGICEVGLSRDAVLEEALGAVMAPGERKAALAAVVCIDAGLGAAVPIGLGDRHASHVRANTILAALQSDAVLDLEVGRANGGKCVVVLGALRNPVARMSAIGRLSVVALSNDLRATKVGCACTEKLISRPSQQEKAEERMHTDDMRGSRSNEDRKNRTSEGVVTGDRSESRRNRGRGSEEGREDVTSKGVAAKNRAQLGRNRCDEQTAAQEGENDAEEHHGGYERRVLFVERLCALRCLFGMKRV